MRIEDLPTPALLLDLDVLERNLQRMARRAHTLGVALRPHVKTHKCIEVAERQREIGAAGITVSTLYEAAVFAKHAFFDQTWAFPVIPSRLSELGALCREARLGVTVDSMTAVESLVEADVTAPVWLKVDCGYQRAGVDPAGSLPLAIAEAIVGAPGLEFAGILSHSGDAYSARSAAEIRAVAETERHTMTTLATTLEEAGMQVPGVSVGSTPSMSQVAHLSGVTEVRPGNYAFYDRVQASLGACTYADCAVTVLASVVSSQPGASHCVIDAGALALSKDRGPAEDPPSMGEIYLDYGEGRLRPEARLVELSQEHGIVNRTFPRGTRLRILPNHSCLTVAQFDTYWVTSADLVVDRWRIWSGREDLESLPRD
jgi:D-serine deaminase-like pyridoxal phosphate-dependent protein